MCIRDRIIKEELQRATINEEVGSIKTLQPDCIGNHCGMSLNSVEQAPGGFKYLSRRSEGYGQKYERFKANLSTAPAAGGGPNEPQATVMISQYIPPSEGVEGHIKELGRLLKIDLVTVDGKNKYRVTVDNGKQADLDYLMIAQEHSSVPSIREGKLTKAEKKLKNKPDNKLSAAEKKEKKAIQHK